MKIITDTREQRPWDMSRFGCEVVSRKLDTGDYSIMGMEHLICLERKSFDDYMGSISRYHRQGSFKDAVDRMREFPYRAIVVETSYQELADGLIFARHRGKLGPNHAIGFADGLIASGVPVLMPGRKYAALQGYNFLRHAHNQILKSAEPDTFTHHNPIKPFELHKYRELFLES